MIIARSTTELQAALPTGQTLANVGFTYKGAWMLHNGHAAAVSRAKELADVTMASFWDVVAFLYFLFGDPFSPSNLVLDEPSTISWCESNGVDILFLTPSNYLEEIFTGENVVQLKQQADQIVINENYLMDSDKFTKILKYLMIMTAIVVERKSIYHQDYHILSWKDGLWTFYRKHYTEKYTSTICELVEPVRDGYIPLSSSYVTYVDEPTKEILRNELNVLDNPNITENDVIGKLDPYGFELVKFEKYGGPLIQGLGSAYVWCEFRVGTQAIAVQDARLFP